MKRLARRLPGVAATAMLLAATGAVRAARYLVWQKRPGEYVYPYDCDPGYGEF